ncbi:MAG: ribosome silencing factor [Crocinitomicaceae bacterium]|nr:ribosome silencing factor [Crocinitomicaceae bacterium]|tara:strand:- start:501 stop:842 length:342 start_codon:yes stop_codon:yes gene_type:complete
MILKDTIIEGLKDGKAKEIVCLDLRKVDGAVSDFFVIAHGDSATHIEGINRSVYKKCSKDLKEKPWQEEGKGNNEWILMDYVNVVAHIFYKDVRENYKLEELWGDAPKEIYES